MSKSKAQGTAFETAIVKAAEAYGLAAGRLPEGGSKDLGDVFIKGNYSEDAIPALAWKRLVKKGGNQRRVPDGVPVVVCVGLPDFLSLLELAEASAIVECKATERLNVTRVLAKHMGKVNRDS